ncbi:MAG: hypothetical protein HYS27_28525 [Deltaproteobacteria bacterium]|nr:hypothetical protein [Deltaproteobacteria bacterium]
MKTVKHLSRAALIGGTALGLLAANGCAKECTDDGVTAVCGDFGSQRFSVDWLWGVRWPAVATQDSRLLVSSSDGLQEIDGQGESRMIQTFDQSAPADPWGVQTTASAPSMDDQGNAFLVVPNGEVQSFGDQGSQRRWAQAVGAGNAAAPPAVGQGVVHVPFVSVDRQGRDLVTLDAATGATLSTRTGASPPVVLADEGLIYMSDTEDCGASYRSVVVEDALGAVRFRHDEPSGVRDFAPGPDGEFYVVTGDRELRRLSADGSTDWTFTPDCMDCTVAGAPTVTADAIYFPVWEGEPPNTGCDDADPTSAEQPIEASDPLYALRRDGSVLWSYDGFTTLAQRYVDGQGTGGLLGFAMQQHVQHHPAGRPVVAADGTLFVPADGAIVALDPNGKELGYALFNPGRGAVGVNGNPDTTWMNSGTENAPVLGEDGRLYHFDGNSVRAFDTDKPAAKVPWSAPFGGSRNGSRLGG